MFREDREFSDAAPSHLGGKPRSEPSEVPPSPEPVTTVTLATSLTVAWAAEAEKELRKIPFFVRGKARANTERFARERALPLITLETLYDAKARFGR
jgi:light-independent protochlorophyllide reductase subunit B